MSLPEFGVISAEQVTAVLRGRERQAMDIVRTTYAAHTAGATVNPRSSFLRFPDRPGSRIIALPASVGGERGADGIKWISSVPANVQRGLPRASAVLILNHQGTGFPIACLEGSIISATRTAASAALAGTLLRPPDSAAGSVGFVGTGLIARHIYRHLVAAGFAFDHVHLHDLSVERAHGFESFIKGTGSAGSVVVHGEPGRVIESSDLIVFATVATEPYVGHPAWFAHSPLVLHVSLRDLAPEVVLGSTNLVDDVDHCLTAGTSLHLTEMQVGHRDFVHATIDDVASGRFRPAAGRTTVFSPFGLGVLDIALAKFVYDEVAAAGQLRTIPAFFEPVGGGHA